LVIFDFQRGSVYWLLHPCMVTQSHIAQTKMLAAVAVMTPSLYLLRFGGHFTSTALHKQRYYCSFLFCQNQNSTNSSIQLSLRLDYMLLLTFQLVGFVCTTVQSQTSAAAVLLSTLQLFLTDSTNITRQKLIKRQKLSRFNST
jgi:hypothetical protein